MRKELYLAIIDRLKSADLGIAHYDFWNTGLSFVKPERGYAAPAVFIEFEAIEWAQLQNSTREADMRIRLHVVCDKNYSTADASPKQKEELGFLTLTERVSAAMHGFATDNACAFMLVESVHDYGQELVYHTEECFTTKVTDISAQRPYVIATGVEKKFEVEYVNLIPGLEPSEE